MSIARAIYLKIEEIADYSPVEPSPHAAANYRRDCMRNPGHEDATIPLSEVQARKLVALVYREYLDAGYTVPKPDKLIQADVNEPVFNHRVPGTVIYARPGEHLHIHVLNADVMPHSFHVHGLRYGIDSDGSWPLGTQASDGRRSDEICPGQTWIYHFDVTAEMVGAWPFHDHSRHIGESVNRGLFGGIIVLSIEQCEGLRPFELPPLAKDFLERRRLAAGDHVAPLPIHPAAIGGGVHHGGGAAGPIVDHEAHAVQLFLEEWSQLAYAHPPIERTDTLHVPVFIHQMTRTRGVPAFHSGPFSPGALPFEVILGAAGTYTYHCEIHPSMQGRIVVAAGEGPEAVVNISDLDPMNMKFVPVEVKIRPGGKVRWTAGTVQHVIVEDGAGFPSFCLNGRSFLGNSPTIVAHTGQRIRWYIFNLDLGMGWHNFHVHGQRFRVGTEVMDTRSIGPAESFVVETVAPPVLLLPEDIEDAQEDLYRKGAKKYEVRGDFLFHCHVEMHMMQGLAGIVRARQTLLLTDGEKARLEASIGIPLDDGRNECAKVDLNRCEPAGCGRWELVAGSPEVCFMHAALLPNSQKLLFFGYGDTRDDLSRIFDYSTPAGSFSTPPNQPFDVTMPVHSRPLANIWSAEHAYLNDARGTLLVHGGFTPQQAFLFDPVTLQWTRTAATADQRFYSTTLTLADGRLMTLFGSASKSIEIYDPGPATWSAPISCPASMNHHVYYPWTYLLPGGKFFIAGPHVPTQRFDGPPAVGNIESFTTIAGDRSSGGEKGTSVLLPLRPPGYAPRALIAGGDFGPAQQTSEWIDLSDPVPAWQALPNLNRPRPHQVNTVLLPDGRVLLVGGLDAADGGPVEIFDPRNPAAGWEMCATMSIPRGYHSAAILLADGSVLMGGDRPGAWKSGETLHHERFFPSYYTLSRPTITGAPATVGNGATFNVDTPSPAAIAEVVLIRPGAVTHGFNMSQRFIECVITGSNATSVQAQAPPHGNIAPPGYYLLFILTVSRVPSIARWIRMT